MIKIPDKDAFIEVLTFLQEYCKDPKARVCEDCILNNRRGCILYTWPEYWEIDEIVQRLYGRFE